MQISSSVNIPVTSGLNNSPTAPIQNSERSSEGVAEKAQNTQTTAPSSKQTTPSIVIDEQAVALYQQSQSSAQISAQSKQSASASQDQPLAKNETAVSSYQAIDNIAKRESVQQLFGVDLFA
ncbi:hypothetical protein NBRC116592_26960 [Colwellia sp. KU-HH00111]|uniref:hypothetical protein n=1 Tax=Colwellia sp. KU-HH00111 TaxID=3127652 RepID=UPI0031070668